MFKFKKLIFFATLIAVAILTMSTDIWGKDQNKKDGKFGKAYSYNELLDHIATGQLGNTYKETSLTVTDVTFSSTGASFSGSSVTINSIPTSNNIESHIQNALMNTTASYNMKAVYSCVFYENGGGQSGYLAEFDMTDTDTVSNWSVYQSGSHYVAEVNLSTNSLYSKYPVFGNYSFNGNPSFTQTFTVYFPGNTEAPTGLYDNQVTYTLNEGETVTLRPTIEPSNSFANTINFSSSNPSIASVDSYGNVTAIKAGSAVISATEPFSGFIISYTIVVNAVEILPTSITLSESNIKLMAGDSVALYASVKPADVTDSTVNWTSSNSSVVSVNNDGLITAKKDGTATITATTVNGKSASCKVTVVGYPTSITIDGGEEIKMTTKETKTLTYSVNPVTTSNYNVEWMTSNNAVVTVRNGVITPVGPGIAYVTVRIKENLVSDSITVVVEEEEIEAKSVSLNKSSAKVYVGDTITLTATINPADTTDKTLTWSTSKSSVATVDKNGNVTGVKAGTATISVKTKNGKTATCTVTVEDKIIEATGVTLNNSSLTIKKGSSATLTATISPKNVTDDTLTWSTSNSAVATVSNGKVTGVKAGTATITVKTKNGKSATCKVTVTEDVLATSISLNKTELTLDKGYSATLTATIAPTNVTDKTVTWSTSDSSVATVSNGKITAVKGGTATITAKTANGKTATCTVNVFEEILPETFKVNNPSISIEEGKTAIIGYTLLPAKSTNKKITWTSSDSSVVSVNGTKVTGIKPGTATITGKTVNGLTATCTVKVKEKTVSITVPSTITAYVGDTVDFSGTTTINPADVTVDKLTWTSSKTNIGTVSGPKFTAKAPGMTYVTAKYGEKSSTCTVIVKSAEDKILDSVTGISINPSSVKEEVGYTKNLAVTISPSTVKASDLDIIWTSSDLSTVYVTSGGQITLKKAGTATITASLANGQNATCTVTVTEPDTTDYSDVYALLTNHKQTVYMNVGDTIKLDYYLSDPNADASKVSLRWNLAASATGLVLNDDGSITAVDAGNGTVRLYTTSAAVTRSTYCNIVVKLNEAQIEEKRLAFANEVLRLCNIEREKAGVAPLQLMDDLNFIAQIRADELTEYGSISVNGGHNRPNGTKWTTVFQNVSVKKRSWGENLIQNYGSPANVVNGWMTSPGHRANILRENFTHMGIGVTFSGSYDSSHIAVQIFIESNE